MRTFTTSPATDTPHNNGKKPPSGALWRWGAVVFWLAVWQLGAMALGQPLLLPSPATVAVRLGQLAVTSPFWQVVLGSLGRILGGFALGFLVGGLLALAGSRWRWVYHLAALPMGVVKATPVASFAILALLFLREGWFSAAIAMLMVLPLAFDNVTAGIAAVDVRLLEMTHVFAFSPVRRLRWLWWPTLLPHLVTTARVGLGFAWKAGVAAEVIAIPANAIGTQLYNAKVTLETTDLFAWTVVIIILSLLLEKGLARLLQPKGAR